MRRATIALSAAAVLATGSIVVWAIQPSYDDIVEDCIAALEGQSEGETARPSACEDVKDEDYTTIRMGQILEGEGWFNEDGSVNREKLLDPDGE